MKWILLFGIILMACRHNERQITDEQKHKTSLPPINRKRASRDTLSHSQPVADNLVIPGERIGRVYLGMENALVVKLLGAPDLQDAAMGKAWLTWKGKRDEHNNATELNVFTAYADSTMRQKTVQLVRTTSNGFVTPSGLRVYSSLIDLQLGHRDLKSVATYQYDHRNFTLYDDKAQGITYEVVAAGKENICTGIIIHPQGKEVLPSYRTRHPDLQTLPD